MRTGRPDFDACIIDLRGVSAMEVAHLWGEVDRLTRDTLGEPIPADEPVFLIRARDVVAAQAINAYADLAFEHGADSAHVESARSWAREVHAWQREHQDRVKVPDRPAAGRSRPEADPRSRCAGPSLGAVETTFTMRFSCEQCGGEIEVEGRRPGHHSAIALSGVRCMFCGASYSLEMEEEPRAVNSLPPLAGDVLDNGARVLDAASAPGGWFVLALHEDGRGAPFATFRLRANNGAAVSGEAYGTMAAALTSFDRRRKERR